MRKLISCLICSLIFSASAYAADSIRQHVPNAELVGEGRLSVAFWSVYDAKLWAPGGHWSEEKPFALSLHYLRDIDGVDIADRTAEEIRKLGFDDEVKLAAWHAQMKKIFPNVKDGTELTGIYVPGKPTRFYDGSREVGVIRDALFGPWFFSIWLSENTSEPSLRRQLLGV